MEYILSSSSWQQAHLWVKMVNCLFLLFFFPLGHFYSHVEFSSAGTCCISFPLQLTVMTAERAEWDSLLSMPCIPPLREGFGSSPVSSPSQCVQARYVRENQLASDTRQIFVFIRSSYINQIKCLTTSLSKKRISQRLPTNKKADLLVKPRKMQHCLGSIMMPVALSIHKQVLVCSKPNLKKKTLLGWLQHMLVWLRIDFHADFCTK